MFNYDVLTEGQIRRRLIIQFLIAAVISIVSFLVAWSIEKQDPWVGNYGLVIMCIAAFTFIFSMLHMVGVLDALFLRNIFVRHSAEFNDRVFEMHNDVRGKACEGEYHRYLRKVIYTRDGLLLTKQELRRLESDLNDYLVRQDISTLEASSVTLGNKVV